jgi:ABC-type glycerol-3-phosphate transport system substrate-binding protein
LEKLSSKFEEKESITLNWVVLEENVLRQKVATDVSQGSGQFDLVYLGLRKGFVPSIKTGIAREAPFDEHSSDSAVANTKQFTVEATSYA